jgi:hypothetical protein
MKRTLLVFILIFTSSSSYSGIFIEAFYDSMIDGLVKERHTPGEEEGERFKTKGSTTGARLGAVWGKGAIGGITYYQSRQEWTLETDTTKQAQNDAGEGIVDNMRGTHYGIFGGRYHDKWFTRAALIASKFVDTDDGGNTDKDDYYKGITYELSAGFLLLRKLVINFTFRLHNLYDYKDNSAERNYILPSSEINKGKVEVRDYMIGLSFPFHWGKL